MSELKSNFGPKGTGDVRRYGKPALLVLALGALACLGWFLGLASSAVAAPTNQQPVIPSLSKGFTAAHYERRGDKFKVLQSTIKGESMTPLSTNEALVRNFLMTTFADGDTNKPQFIITGPECRLDINPRSNQATSTNRIRVYMANTNFVLEGVGFSVSQTNQLLVVSNSVATRLPKPATKSPGSALTASTLLSAPPDSTNFFRIFSDHFKLYYESNLVIYTGHVLVLDSNAELRCEFLQARLNTNRTIEHILAETNISIVTPDQGEAWGDRADCILNAGEQITLSGHAHWKNGLRESKADQFTFNFTPTNTLDIIRADGSAAIRLPDSELKSTNVSSSLPKVNLASDTNHFTEVFADHVTVHNSPPNGIDRILAENHVVITNEFQQIRATGDRGIYTRTNEQFELSGNPLMQSVAKGEIRADYLTFSRTNQSFTGRGNSKLKILLANLSDAQSLKLGLTNGPGTNRYLTVESQLSHYQSNVATFKTDVKASVLQADHTLGTLDSQWLEVRFDTNNNVQQVAAKDHVRGETAPWGRVLSRKFSCDSLTALLWPESRNLQSVNGKGHVWAEQVESTLGTTIPKVTTLNADSVAAQFERQSNTVANAIATNNVRATQCNGPATNVLSGQRVVYDGGTNETVQLTGNPEVRYFGPAFGKTSSTNAAQGGTTSAARPTGVRATGDTLIWHLKTDTFTGINYDIVPLNMTNIPELKPASTNR